jgi:hypothetical protein
MKCSGTKLHGKSVRTDIDRGNPTETRTNIGNFKNPNGVKINGLRRSYRNQNEY